jgi:hypothetical protein
MKGAVTGKGVPYIEADLVPIGLCVNYDVRCRMA